MAHSFTIDFKLLLGDNDDDWVSVPQVQVSLYEFVEQMVKTGTLFTQVLQELVHEIQVRRAGGVSGEVEEKLKEIERNIPHGLSGELEGLSVLLKASAA